MLRFIRRENFAKKIPPTVLSGYLGKTTLLYYILKNYDGLRIALIGNDMSEMTLTELDKQDEELSRTEEKLVEIPTQKFE